MDTESLIQDRSFFELLKRKAGTMQGNSREQIKIGIKVRVVKKEDQSSGKLTEGTVRRILTKSPTHPHGIKVMLEDGVVGRVKEIIA